MDSDETSEQEPAPVEEPAPPTPRPLAVPIESRFLFVDVAAMRAKQLRRGALVRIEEEQIAAMRVVPHKPERIAMEEVRRNLVLYETPPLPKAPPEA